MEHARRAQAGDLDRIVELAAVLDDELAPMRGGELWSAREARPKPFDAQYEPLLSRSDACVVVGTIGEYVVGFGVVELEQLREWFDKHAVPESIDHRIAADFEARRLDKAIDEALEDDKRGRTTPL